MAMAVAPTVIFQLNQHDAVPRILRELGRGSWVGVTAVNLAVTLSV
jgi:hypothetical protein